MYKNTSLKNFILILLAFAISFSGLNSHIPDYRFVRIAVDTATESHAATRPLLPAAHTLRNRFSDMETGAISGMKLRYILYGISQRKTRCPGREFFRYIGVVSLKNESFFIENFIRRIKTKSHILFLYQIIKYIHNQDGEKSATSPVPS